MIIQYGSAIFHREDSIWDSAPLQLTSGASLRSEAPLAALRCLFGPEPTRVHPYGLLATSWLAGSLVLEGACDMRRRA